MDHASTTLKLREQLKVLLYYFAKHSEQPGMELQDMLKEVIQELYAEVATATAKTQEKTAARGGKSAPRMKLLVSNHH
jgi:hypothetical protein